MAPTNYTSHTVTVLGNIFTVLVATGQSNYVAIRKETNNPYKLAGRQFANFTEASNAYKSPAMKIALLSIEINN